MSLDSLLKIGMRHGTDKPCHQFLPHYDAIFSPRRNDHLQLMEIGINNVTSTEGGSLRMWKEYFPNAEIYGIDAMSEKAFTEDRISVFTGLQGDAEFLRSVVASTGLLDVVVDDGSHFSRDHIASFAALWPHIRPDGWYCIEDCVSIFNDCWTQPGERTILDVIWERLKSILSTGQDSINEIRIIGDGCNDGLIMLRKRVTNL
jgi:hypothetical protein